MYVHMYICAKWRIGWLPWRRIHPELMGVISQDPRGLQDNSSVTEEDPHWGPGPEK